MKTGDTIFVGIMDKKGDVDYTNHGNAKKHSEWPHEHTYEWYPNGKFRRIP